MAHESQDRGMRSRTPAGRDWREVEGADFARTVSRRAAARPTMQGAAGHQPEGPHRPASRTGTGRCGATQGLCRETPARRVFTDALRRNAARTDSANARARPAKLRSAEAAAAGRTVCADEL